MRKLNISATILNICDFIRTQVNAADAEGVVIGLSGGIDSAVTAHFCVNALGTDSVLGMIMPCESDPEDARDATRVVEQLGMTYMQRDLTKTVATVADAINISKRGLAYANLKSRLRMCALYAHANKENLLVAGTTNLAEWVIGYYTKYGDGGVDIEPIIGLTKGEVRLLAAEFGMPASILEKPPSAGLWEGQTDEAELGMTYAELDEFSLRTLNPEFNINDEMQSDDSQYLKFLELYTFSDHKRQAVPACWAGPVMKELE